MRKSRTAETEKFYTSVGKRIAEARKNFPKTQQALASDLQMTRASVVNIERGRQQLHLHTVVKIARSLGVSPESLIPEYSSDVVSISSYVSNPKGVAWIEKALSTESIES